MQTSDFFSLFSLPRNYALDMHALEQAYFTSQQLFHPDRASAKSPMEKQQAMQVSVRLNDAYNTLRSPLKRAEYMLSFQGGTEAKPDTTLLTEVIEWREDLLDTESPEQLQSLAQRAEQQEQACIDSLGKAFAQGDIAAATQLTLRLSYVTKYQDEIRQKLLAAKRLRPAS